MNAEVLRRWAPVTFADKMREKVINNDQFKTAKHEVEHAVVAIRVGTMNFIAARDQGGGTSGMVSAAAGNDQGQIAIAMASSEGGHGGTGWDRFISRVIELRTNGHATVEIGRKIARGIIFSIPQRVKDQSARILIADYNGQASGGQYKSIEQQARFEVREMAKESTLLRKVVSIIGKSGEIFSSKDKSPLPQAA